MATIALRDYYREIEQWLDQSLYDQVISHCRYILNIYPKSIDTYQLLGKAYLENKQYSDAIDLFQRVLSSRPDDFVSHIGISIIREDEGNLNEAIWHMERAYEIQPSNKAIQGELRRLIGKSTGAEPAKINLNRGALARMYIKGNLQSQAIAEIRMALAEDPKRPDLQVLLAKAYYDLHQEKDAAEVSSELITTLPYCFDANLILYHIVLTNNKPREAQSYLDKLIELDPYAKFLSDDTFAPDMAPDSAVMIEHLEGIESQEKVNLSFSPDWTTGEQQNEKMKSEETQEDWLSGFAPGSEEIKPDELESEPPTSEIPDWLREAGWEEPNPEASAEEPKTTPPFSDEEGLEIEAGEIPDWLKELSPIESPAPELGETLLPEQDIESILAESAEPSSEVELPDWMKSLETMQGISPEEPTPIIQSEEKNTPEIEVPEWLSEEETEKAETTIPEWFSEESNLVEKLNLEEEPSISELDTKPVVIRFESTPLPLELSDTESPDWVKEYLENQIENEEIGTSEAGDLLTEKEMVQPEEATIPDWLKATLESQLVSDENPTSQVIEESPEINSIENLFEETATPSEVLPEQEIPEWGIETPEMEVKEEVTQEKEELAQEELPDWIKEQLSEEPFEKTLVQSEEIAEEELPDWIKAEFGEQEIAVKENLEEQELNQLPDWISEELTTPVVETPTPAEEELPDWLKPELVEYSLGEQIEIRSEEPTGEEILENVPEQPIPAQEVEQVEIPEAELVPAQPPTEAISEWRKEFETPQEPMVTLNDARSALQGGELETALFGYAKLIQQRRELDAILNDLSSAVYQFPMEIKMWMLLGDAYLRKDMLAEALNAYNKAEELIR